MYAVIRTGGKQYRVAAEDVISVEKLPGEAGEQVVFEDVLLVGNGDEATIGSPLVDGASVAGEVVEQTRGRKIIVFKKKRRKNYRRTKGHRQHLTLVRITEVLTEGAKPSPKKAKKAPKAAEDEAAAKGEAKETKAKPAKKAHPKSGAKPAEQKKAPAKKSGPKKAKAEKAEAKAKDATAETAPETRAADEAKKD